MKITGYILILVLAFLTVQPLLSNTVAREEKTECCLKDKKCPNQKNTCDQTACNPLRVCVYGSFFIVDNTTTDVTVPTASVQMADATNDNRIYSSLSDCWHPPRI